MGLLFYISFNIFITYTTEIDLQWNISNTACSITFSADHVVCAMQHYSLGLSSYILYLSQSKLFVQANTCTYLRIAFGSSTRIRLPVDDQDGDDVRCRLANSFECKGGCTNIPPSALRLDRVMKFYNSVPILIKLLNLSS